MHLELNRRSFVGAAVATGAAAVAFPGRAHAVTSEEKQAEIQQVTTQLESLNSEFEAAVQQYNKAQDDYNDATNAVEECQEKIAASESKISTLQGRLDTRATSMYRNGSMSYLDVLLGTASFADFATVWDTLNSLNEDDANLVSESKTAKAELEATKEELAANQQAAKAAVVEANTYKTTVEQKQAEYNNLYDSLSAEYQELVQKEQEERERAAAAAAAAYTPTVRQETTSNDTNNNTNTDGGGNGSSNSSAGNTGGGNARSSSSDDDGDDDSSSSSSSSSSNSSSSSSSASSIPTNGSVVDYAESRLGCSYVWGASGPNSFDCSGFTMWCYAQIGISLPHYTESQYACAKAVLNVEDAQPGDILYHSGHVGISTGGASCIEAMGSAYGVCRSNNAGRWVCALRF